MPAWQAESPLHKEFLHAAKKVEASNTGSLLFLFRGVFGKAALQVKEI
jgi:hypothetical protein